MFPGGVVGAGLLLLRISVAVSLVCSACVVPEPYDLTLLPGVVAAAGLSIGLGTRLLAGLGCLALVLCMPVGLLSPGSVGPAALAAAALTLTGAGGLSLDAHMFGRRTIKLTDRDDSIV